MRGKSFSNLPSTPPYFEAVYDRMITRSVTLRKRAFGIVKSEAHERAKGKG